MDRQAVRLPSQGDSVSSRQKRAARRGIDAERQAQRQLEDAGYTTVRSAGSHGPFDVIALNGRESLWIQVKSVTKDRSWRPVLNELAAICRPPFARVQLWVRQYRRKGWLHKIEVTHHCEEEQACTPLLRTAVGARSAS